MDYIINLFSGELTWLDVVIRVAVSMLIGIAIGIERELSNHPAGMKTHALVCLGAAITTMISAEMCYSLMGNEALDASSKVDMSRIASGVVSGIGFIGAGAIIKSKDGSVVTGITTAATVWISGCMGLAIGMGYFRIIVVAMLAILFTTGILKGLEQRFIKQRGTRYIEVITDDRPNALPTLEDYFDRKQIVVTAFDCILNDNESDGEKKSEKNEYKFRYYLRIPKGIPFNTVMRDIAKMTEITEVYEADPAEMKKRKS
ncbi:MAG: MgtC/SapB family protein [Clostridia bacterium]|nr:MgtC/SapB family protein [Clostridia bacterium]